MRLTVVEVAYALGPPLGSGAVGGAEQVLGMVDGALVAAGHRSVVVAPEGSQVRGALYATPAHEGPFDPGLWAAADRLHERSLARAIAAEKPDLVHFHGADFDRFLPEGVRSLVTLHLPPTWYRPEALRARSADVSFVCVSDSQARTLPPGVRVAGVVENGVPLDVYRPGGAKEPFALVLGRICPEKGIAPALAAARRAGLPLLVCGRVFPYPAHLRYLEEEVRPLLDAGRRLLGPIGGAHKAALLRAARCVVVPSLAPETSSLVAMEALASGTPVVARRTGALPDIVEDGRTGFLFDRDDELAEAIRQAGRLSPAECRRAAEARFSDEAAGRRWLSVIARLARRRLHPRPRRPDRRMEIVQGLDGLRALAPEWSSLCDRSPSAAPFTRPEWVIPFCRAHGVSEPFAVALRRRGRLVALAPFVSYDDRGGRTLTLLGGGLSDYQDAIVDPDLGDDAAAFLLRGALARTPQCETVLLEHLPATSPLRTVEGGLGGALGPDGVCPARALPRDPDRLLGSLSPRLADRIRYGRRRLARLGARVSTATLDDLDRHLAALVALHGARWNARSEPGVLAEARLRAFHAEAARGLLRRGLLRLHVLWAGGCAVAAFHGFLDQGRLSYYLGGFDPALRAASPGAVVIAHALEAAIAEGAREVDFLRGREPYKYEWGAQDRETWSRVIAPGRAGRLASPVAPTVLTP